MLKFKLCVALLFSLLFAENNSTLDFTNLEYLYKSAVRDYRIGSYYNALDEFTHIIKYPQSPFYLDALKMLAKTYLNIGKRTGNKKYLWSAQNFLNLYLAKGGKRDSDYYYVKGEIFEILGFYERALSNYKLALQFAGDKKEKLKIIIGILRSSVWLKKLDIATKYMVILNIEMLTKEQKKEFEFLKGMYYFVKGDYAKAIEFFQKSYRYNESFLIDNPEYYYIVAETAYRIGDIDFARKLFRRIINYVKHKEVIQKSLLRLGDIKFLEGEFKASASYYYRLIKSFPDSRYATIAKLKLLFLIKQNREIGHYIKKYLPDAYFLKHPDKFVLQTLVKNRNNYIGLFALANFGMSVFELESEKLFDRLGWELSLVSPNKLKYEHIEYFKRVWSPYILKEKNPSFICKLFFSNREFFFRVFSKRVLKKVGEDIKKCRGEKEYIRFLEEMAKRFDDDGLYFDLVEEYIKTGEYEKAYDKLKNIKKRDCRYLRYRAGVCFLLQKGCSKDIESYLSQCKEKGLYKEIFKAVKDGKIDSKFIEKYAPRLAELYPKDAVVRKFVKLVVDRLLEQERYEDIVNILYMLRDSVKKDCYLDSVLALSYIRSGKIDYGKKIVSEIKNCDNIWYKIAKAALEDEELKEEVENVGKN